MRDREENWGGRREGIRDSPKTGVLSGTHLCRDYVSSFHGIIHWTWWIVIFFHFSSFFFFNLLTSILILRVFFCFFFRFFTSLRYHQSAIQRRDTQQHATQKSGTGKHTSTYSLCEKKKNCTQKESEAFHRNSFSKTCTSLKVINLDDLESGRKKC